MIAATLEFTLAPEDLGALAHHDGLARAAASRTASVVCYDDAEATLASGGAILVQRERLWRLVRLAPGRDADWPACGPAPVIAEGAAPADLLPNLLEPVAVAALDGERLGYHHGEVALDVLHGTFRGGAYARPSCRLRLEGPADALAEVVPALSDLRLAVPRASLEQEAIAAAQGRELPPRHLGAPALPPDIAVGDGFAAITTHLLDALLFWVDRYRRVSEAEAAHQARVATRRLRSALSLYKRVIAAPELEAVGAALKDCAGRLGAARDWDVFLEHTGAKLSTQDDKRLAALLRAARRRRETAHAALLAYLDGAEFRHLELLLGVAASLRPWERGGDPDMLRAPTRAFSAAVLARRHKQVRQRGRHLDAVPTPALHELRKDCKRLRYAAEFFTPAFPAKTVRPYVKRLASLQEALGALNDAHAVSALMAQLGRAGAGYAGGMALGWAGADAAPARDRVGKRWRRFRAATPFWADWIRADGRFLRRRLQGAGPIDRQPHGFRSGTSVRQRRRIFRGSPVARLRAGPALRAAGAVAVATGALAMTFSGSLFSRSPPPSSRLTAEANDIAVIDGETLRLDGQVVRLRGVDAPDRGDRCRGGQDCGGAATSALAGLVRGRRVECAIAGLDGAGRAYAACEANGTDLSRAIVASGWARAKPNTPELADLELRARRQRWGLWADATPR